MTQSTSITTRHDPAANERLIALVLRGEALLQAQERPIPTPIAPEARDEQATAKRPA